MSESETHDAAGSSLRNLIFAAEQGYAAATSSSAGVDGHSSSLAAAQSSLLQLHSLLSVTAAGQQAPASRHQADSLLQQCTSRLTALTVQHHKSAGRRARVAELLQQAGCPEGFKFGSPDGFDLGAKLRQSEPHKSLLAPALPSLRVQLTPPAPAQQAQADPAAPAGVLAEQPCNPPPGKRRSGFQVPAAKPSGHQQQPQQQQQPHPAALDAYMRQQQQQGPPPSYPTQQQRQQQNQHHHRHHHHQPAEPARQQQGSRWAAKVQRRAQDSHVHQGRRRHTSDDDSGVIHLGSSSGEEGEGGSQEAGGCQGGGPAGFQTAKTKLVADLRKAGQQYNPGQYGGGAGGAPRQGLARAGGGNRPAGLRKTGGGAAVGGAGAAGKFVPPYLRKALEAQNGGGPNGGGGGGEGEAEGPLSQRTLEILRLAPGEALPEALAKLDPLLIENVCSEVMDSGGQLDWNDIAGQQTAKDLIQEVVVWPIKNPQLFTGARAPPKGILLFGPPGTGKTMLGKAIATNISAVFFSISASSLVSKWMGEGEKLVRALFAVAAHVAPSVIFIDEVDSLLSARKSDGEHESMRRLKTEILVQMEGVDPTRAERRVLLVGATNRPEELDEAARRRMPKQLYIPLPDAGARQDLILRQLGPGCPIQAQLDESDLQKVVARTQGYSGSDMKMLIQEACQGPVRDAFKASAGALAELRAEELRPVVLRDFQMASRAQKASVEPAEIERYEQYNQKHGAKLAGSCGEGMEEEEEDW